jgi:8-amino-7-oxononanoate synthase
VVLLERAAALRAALREQGWNIGQSQSQIIPIFIGDADRAVQLSLRLREHGLFVPAIRPPSVPFGQSLLRISLSFGHAPDMIERLTTALAP